MKGKRIISSLLSMAMVFTLNAGISFADEVPVTEEPVVEEQPYEDPVVDDQPVVEENPVVEDDPVEEQEPETPVVEEEPDDQKDEYPAKTFTGKTPDGRITVEVIAGEGALPKDASMRVENVSKSAVTDLVNPLVGGEIDSLSAVDVIFTNAAGDIIEPLTEIVVKIKTNELEDADRYQLVHIDQANNAEKISEDKVIDINKKEATFATDVFSIYVIIGVSESGAIDFDETFGSNHLIINAPDGAFAPGTEMVLSSVEDKTAVNKIISKLGNSNGAELFLLDISFYKDGVEVEPALPVNVTWESAYIQGSKSSIVHVLDNGEVETVNANVTDGKVSFTSESFSPYGIVTIRQSTVPKEYFTFNPSGMVPVEEFDSVKAGPVAANAPRFNDYAFQNATIKVYDETTQRYTDVEVLEVGAFIVQYDDGRPDEYNVFYRTPESMQVTDMIVLLADGEKINYHYSSAPLDVTYVINYEGHNYTLTSQQIMDKTIPDELKSILGADGDSVVLSGPEIIAENTAYEYSINVQIPRGYSATTTINSRTLGDLGEPTEPTYSLSNDTITGTGELKLEDTYSISASTVNQVVTMNLSKRESFTFDASYFLHTKYTGGSTTTYGDSTVSPASNNSRITGDGTLSAGKKTFTADSMSWTFTTNNRESSSWWLDALEINGTTLGVPYLGADQTFTDPIVKTTELPSGTVITVSLVNKTGSGRNERRTYTVSASNAYENLVITSGNIYNSNNSTEIIPEVLDNVNYQFYGYTTSDNAYAHRGLGWQDWTVGQPIAVGQNQSTGGTSNYNMYGFNQSANQAMRFSVPEGYASPEIAYVTSTEDDLRTYIGSELSLGTKTSDGYYPITSSPNNGYYNFRITGQGNNNKLTLLRIRAKLMRFGISYTSSSDGPANPENVPEFDNGGTYGDGTLKGYNVEDNKIITISKKALKDPNDQYVFLYYTIEGDTSGTTYAPGQKVEGEAFSRFISFAEYDSSRNEYVIPLVANWARKEDVETVTVLVDFFLDGSSEPVHQSAPLQVAKGSSIYIDIDSEEMDEFMTEYNWELFYDESTSDVYESKIQEDKVFTVQCYSKFYVYHSGSGELELHTKKELVDTNGVYDVYGDVQNRIPDGTLYGGYYLAYDADTSGQVVNAAKNDALHGEINAMQVANLSNGGFEVVATCSAIYDVNVAGTNAWSNPQTSSSVSVPTAQKGDHNPTIYYIKEVPDAYLSNYYEIVYRKDTEKLTGLYLMSVIDDLNYNDTGLKLQSSDSQQATVVHTLFFQQEGTGNVTMIRGNNAFNKDGVVNVSYLTYWKATDSSYFAPGTFTVTPYWQTPDGVPITGKTRTVTISDMTKSGISKED